jgi:23S rRNA pseudouridine1911/1915/1917 synthase
MPLEITILYESAYLLAVDKPAGLLVERSPYFPSLEAWAEGYLAKRPGRHIAGIAHRLDRAVSGALAIAVKKSALRLLNEQFRQKLVEKVYLALSKKAPPAPEGQLTHWLRKDQKNKRAEAREHPFAGAVECRLRYRLLGRRGDRFLWEIQPESGKFHQIRAQLAAAGCPILGDEKYGSSVEFHPEAIALHAWKLAFTEPISGKLLRLEAALPADYL